MRTRARSVLVVGLLGGGLLVALPAAGATEPPPECERVAVLARSFQPSKAVALAVQVSAAAATVPPTPRGPAAPVDPAGTASPAPSASAAPACAKALGDAAERAAAARVALRLAKGQDAEAVAIETGDPAAAAELRGQADALYALALTTDAGLTEARAGLDPQSVGAANTARLSAARQVAAIDEPDAARLLASDLVLTGASTAEQVKAAGLAPASSFQERLQDWRASGVSWLNAVAPYIAAAAILALIVLFVRRPRDYELQAPTHGAGLEVVEDWSATVPEALDALSLESPAVRYLATPDAEFKLPTINGMPVGFLAVVEFWTWIRRIRRRVVTTTLELVEGTPTANVAIRKRNGRPLKRMTLRAIRTSAAPPLSAEQVRQAFVDLASEEAAWIAFEFTAPAERVSIFGSTSPDAVVHVAGAAAAKRRNDRPTIRAELNAARVADPKMLEARLNLAVLDITEAGSEVFTLNTEAVIRGISGLTATVAGAGERLALTDPGVVGPGPGPGPAARRDWARLMAIDVRARYNREIAWLNMSAKPLPEADRAVRAEALVEVGARAGLLVTTMGASRKFEGVVRTARDIRRQAWLLWVGHAVEWQGALEPRLSQILSLWPDVETGATSWPGMTGALVAADSPSGDVDVDATPAMAAYSIACIAAEQDSVADITTWLDRAIKKDAPRYLRAARRDPYFVNKGLGLPDPDAVPDAEVAEPAGAPVATAVVVVNVGGQNP